MARAAARAARAPNADDPPPVSIVEAKRRLLPALGEVALLTGGFFALRAAGRRKLRRLLAMLEPKDAEALLSSAISTLHALPAGVLSLWQVLGSDTFRGSRIWSGYSRSVDLLLSFSSAFALYELGLMLGRRQPVELWAHHAVMASGAFLMKLIRQAAFFPIAFQTTELTAAFSHAEWALRKLGLRYMYPRAYRVVSVLRLAAWLAFRTFVGPLVFWRLLRSPGWRQRVAKCHPLVVACSLFNMLFLSAANLVWTRRVARTLVAEWNFMG